jgi:hypothetical protein
MLIDVVDPSLEWSVEQLLLNAQVYGLWTESEVFDISVRSSQSGELANGQLDDEPQPI